MKRIFRILCILMIMVTVVLGSSLPAYSSDLITDGLYVNVNGSRIQADISPVIKDDRMLVPLRGVIEKLGSTPEWDDENQKVTINYKNLNIIMQVGSKAALVNGETRYLDVPPFLHKDRVLVPLRFIAENMGMWVKWVPEANLAAITDPGYFSSLPATTVLGYTTNDYWGDNGSYSSLTVNHENMNAIATFSHIFGADGSLRLSGGSQANTVQFANNNGIKPLLLVHNFRNGGFDIDLAHAVLTNTQSRKNLVNNILVALSKEEYAGVNVDIEHMYWYDRPYYTAFIRELKETLEPHGFLTTVAMIAKNDDAYQNNNWSGAFDYREIGKYADQILLMTYDEHYIGGAAGAVASYPWVESVLKYATSVIPSNKLLMGIAAYGYDWSSTGTKALQVRNIGNLISSTGAAVQWDAASQTPYFSYYKNGVRHEVWYENAASISAKLDLVAKYNLRGVGVWRMGYETKELWDTIGQKIHVIK